jgi:hypothetical protein
LGTGETPARNYNAFTRRRGKDRRDEVAVRGVEDAGAGAGLFGCDGEFEHEAIITLPARKRPAMNRRAEIRESGEADLPARIDKPGHRPWLVFFCHVIASQKRQFC